MVKVVQEKKVTMITCFSFYVLKICWRDLEIKKGRGRDHLVDSANKVTRYAKKNCHALELAKLVYTQYTL